MGFGRPSRSNSSGPFIISIRRLSAVNSVDDSSLRLDLFTSELHHYPGSIQATFQRSPNGQEKFFAKKHLQGDVASNLQANAAQIITTWFRFRSSVAVASNTIVYNLIKLWSLPPPPACHCLADITNVIVSIKPSSSNGIIITN